MRKHALAMVACWGVAGCGDSDLLMGPVADLERAEARWERVRPDSYVFAIERVCFCGSDSRGPVRVTVDGSSVVERVYVDTGEPVPTPLADYFPTVEGLFDIIRSAFEENAHEVRVTYDQVLGVPTEFWIDYLEFAADEELGMRITEEVEAISTP